MFDRVGAKTRSKEQMKGNLGVLICTVLVAGVIQGGLSLVPVVGSFAVILFAPVLSVGINLVFLNLAMGHPIQLEQMFALRAYWWKAFCLSFWVGLRIFLWSLLFIIPGIIAAYRYSMTEYIFVENPNMPNAEIMEKSKEMTTGCIWDLFVLELSFIGWSILTMITFGLAAFWVAPYMQTVYANVYLALKAPGRQY